MERTNVLVVEPDAVRRDEISGWLEDEGWDVLMCAGPQAPGYVCLGGKNERCPLATAADTVVLDLQLDSDAAFCGTPGWVLLLYYYEQGKRVVALTGDDDPVHPISDDEVTVIPRSADRSMVVRAVRRAGKAKGGDRGEHPAR